MRTSTRASRAAPFQAVNPPAPFSTTRQAYSVNVSADHLLLFATQFSSPTFVAGRANTGVAFVEGAINTANAVITPATVVFSYRAAGGGELWSAQALTAGGPRQIYVAKRTGATVMSSVLLAELGTNVEQNVRPSEDGLTVVFASNRAGGAGNTDLYLAKRTATTLPFDTLTRLSELATADFELSPWLSTDGCRLYFLRAAGLANFGPDVTTSNRAKLFVAERPK